MILIGLKGVTFKERVFTNAAQGWKVGDIEARETHAAFESSFFDALEKGQTGEADGWKRLAVAE